MTDFDVLERKVSQAERALDREIGEAKALARQIQKVSLEAENLELKVKACEEAVTVLNSFADQRQHDVQRQVEGLVSHGLRTIFDDELSFHIVSETKARRSEVRFVIRSKVGDEEIETSILDARGGGVAAVAGFLLRLIVMLLQPGVRRLMVLDETFGQVSSDYELKLVEFVRQLVDQSGAQIVLITHKAIEEWTEVADKAYRFTLRGGWSEVELLK